MGDQPAWEKIGVAAALSKSYEEDQPRFLERLAQWLREIMPSETKLRRRGLFSTGAIQKIALSTGEFQYGLEVESTGSLLFTRAKVVKGIALKTDEIPPENWLTELAQILEKRAEGSRAAREALSKLIL